MDHSTPPGWKGHVIASPTAPPQPYSVPSQPLTLTDDQVRLVAAQFDIETKYASELKHLTYYDIVVILDDSGSMIAPTSGFQSRWDEAHKMLQIIADMLRQLKGVDTRLIVLNRTDIRTTSEVLGVWPSLRPAGPTPIRAAFESLNIGTEVPTLIILITDGEPTLVTCSKDGHYENAVDAQFSQFIQNFQTRHSKVYINVILCTNNDSTVRFWKQIDHMPRIDVIDDYETEQKGSRRGLTFGTYVAKAMLGALVPELDKDDTGDCCMIL